MANFPTYEFQGDQIVAKDNDTVIASGNEFAKVAHSAQAYFEAIEKEKENKVRKVATHVITPNGLKAEILGRTSSVWDEEVTVRFENGQIRHLAVSHGDGANLKYIREEKEPDNSVMALHSQLDETFIPSQEGILARLNDLEKLVHTAKNKIVASKSQEEQKDLDQIILHASHEKAELGEALEHLAHSNAEAYTFPKRAYEAVEQASMGRDDSWLEVVASEMIAESESHDYDKLLQEGPVRLMASLDDGSIHDAAIVREIAFNDVMGKTAGFAGEEVDNYRMQYVAATEVLRQQEVRTRTRAMSREASVREAAVEGATDESLFL